MSLGAATQRWLRRGGGGGGWSRRCVLEAGGGVVLLPVTNLQLVAEAAVQDGGGVFVTGARAPRGRAVHNSCNQSSGRSPLMIDVHFSFYLATILDYYYFLFRSLQNNNWSSILSISIGAASQYHHYIGAANTKKIWEM